MSGQPTWEDLRKRQQEAAAKGQSPAHAAMLFRHGEGPSGTRCGDCAHLRKIYGDMAVHPFKCFAYRNTRSAATDWRLKWSACGNYQSRDSAKGE